MVSQKQQDSLYLAYTEVISCVIVLLTLRFNSEKTAKTGKLYDELNLTASDYTIYINLNAIHRHEFETKYQRELNDHQDQFSRGYFIKKYVEEKLASENMDIARVDLVFDNKKMIELLEARGNALKL